ncbi:MAG: hypothetical protein AB7O32_00535 [Vicinamibacterales bacterium]
MEPILTKVSLARALVELVAYAGTSAVALTMSTAEVGIAVTVVGGVIGVVVWLVRLEGRINTQAEILTRVDRRTERLAEHMGVVE